ncbi:MAG: 50S ribosomal protein L11 methyltransferase [Parasphingorhabdus sp.]|uniref:50S ribosomal protein L11 methyltransferase n=1 Tax=Parasphingorhabdus sp. TaxID=2709688 RepID=UPI00329A047F
MSDGWKLSLPCTREEADRLSEDSLLSNAIENVPTIVTREANPNTPDDWVIEIYCDEKPDAGILSNIAQLSPSALLNNITATIEKLPDEDWVTLSQQGLEPLRAGRFYVHTSNSAPLADSEIINICINAGQAFGTGHHETTLGCLENLDRLKRLGQIYHNIIDVGTGTGLLAFAAHHLWPTAQIIASDIDPVAIAVSAQNAQRNGIATGSTRTAIQLETSNGLDHPAVGARAPYDLIIANILAGPLIALAPQIASAASSGTVLLLAGLLKTQKADVLHAYMRQGFRLHHSRIEAEWPCLTLVKAQQFGPRKTVNIRRSPLASDYFGEC